MTREVDLDRHDKATILLWRVSNLVGWGLAGTGLYVVPWVAMWAVADRFQGRVSGVIAAPASILFLCASLVLLPAVVGRVVGEHVYRWPASIALAAVAFPQAYWFVTSDMDGTDGMAALAVTTIGVFIAAVTARDRWSERPRALRVSSSR